MQIYYLEIVTNAVDAVCAAYAAAEGAQFGKPDAGLGNARTAEMPGGGLLGVRAPLRATEDPVVRPYWLVDNIEAAVAAVEEAGGEIAVPPMAIPGMALSPSTSKAALTTASGSGKRVPVHEAERPNDSCC